MRRNQLLGSSETTPRAGPCGVDLKLQLGRGHRIGSGAGHIGAGLAVEAAARNSSGKAGTATKRGWARRRLSKAGQRRSIHHGGG